MKVLDLQCSQNHVFEGWFASEGDFSRQLEARQIECPLCANADITKRLSAPRLNFHVADRLGATPGERATPEPGQRSVALQKQWLELARHIVANTEDVGDGFAQEARRIHYGETAPRGIRGQASQQDTRQLLDEGIAVMPLPLPVATKETLQ